MGGGGGDDDEEGESEDEDEVGEDSTCREGIETKRRNQWSFYLRTGTVIRTTSHHGSGTCWTEVLKSCKTTFRSVILN